MCMKLLLLLTIAGLILAATGQDVSSELQGLSEKVSGLGTKIDTVASEVEDVGDEVDDLEDELEDVGDNIEDGINDLEQEVGVVGGDVTDLQIEVVSLRSEVQILRASLETELEKLRNEVKSLGGGGGTAGDACNTEGIYEELVCLKTGQTTLLQALQEIKEQLTTTAAQGSTDRANIETRLMATNEQVHNISRELTDLSHSKMNNIESDLKDLKIDLASVREELNKTATSTLSEFKGQLESVRKELDTMQENTNSTLQELKGQLTDMAHQLTDTASQGSRERATIQAGIAEVVTNKLFQNTTMQLHDLTQSNQVTTENEFKHIEDRLSDDLTTVRNQLGTFQGDVNSTLQSLTIQVTDEFKHVEFRLNEDLSTVRNQLGTFRGDMNLTLQSLREQVIDGLHRGSQERQELKATLETRITEVASKVELGSLRDQEHQTTTTEQFKNISREVHDIIPQLETTCNLSSIVAVQYIPSSCYEVPNLGHRPSGFYDIRIPSTGELKSVFCDMERRCSCGSIGGWMRVAYLDMTDPSQQCPEGFLLRTSPKRVCERTAAGCASIIFPTHSVQYSRVCGQARAYQIGGPDSFEEYYNGRQSTIDDAYVYGLSITHGSGPRKHIWTFAAAEDETQSHQEVCPCTKTDTPYTGRVPPFIGTDYFCETGSRGSRVTGTFYPEDPLWDGQGCGPTSSCCQFNSPPWFCKELPQPTADDIEVRMCHYESALELIEMYIQ